MGYLDGVAQFLRDQDGVPAGPLRAQSQLAQADLFAER